MKTAICLILFLMPLLLIAQTQQEGKGKSLRFTSAHSMFPDSLRNTVPRVYDGKTYNTADHYSDSSLYVFVPDYFDPSKPFSYVCWFHGWSNTIDSALAFFKLRQQFYDAGKNAIFVFPEGPVNAPDSYAGKFEKPGNFDHFVEDINRKLVHENILKPGQFPNNMVYAGHSGAYRVISFLLLYATKPCKGILLFDALYSEQEKFAMYLQTHPDCKFIDIFTDENEGGTFQNSKNMIVDMKGWHWPLIEKEEDNCTTADLTNNRIIFLHSIKHHNDVITNHLNFERFLKALN